MEVSVGSGGTTGTIGFEVDGRQVTVPDDGASLLEALRDRLGVRSPKDGCSPQGQCGCCTVLVDGAPRVACVTPARRVAGRRITTIDGLADAGRWADAFCRTGASQCGFCTPGIIVRLAGIEARGTAADDEAAVERALAAHLCRCTGWRTILDAWSDATGPEGQRAERDLDRAAQRATLEGGVPQRVGPEVGLGRGGFADDLAPPDALVAVLDPDGGWAVAETLVEARAAAGKVQGRRTTRRVTHPLELPAGDWDVTLRTTWVEPAYLETDASWSEPGGEPMTPLANGGAFGGKVTSVAPTAARELADRYGRPVRVLLAREDTVRLGPKRPPIAAGVNADGTGIVRTVRTEGIAETMTSYAPGLVVDEVDVAGPPTSTAVRAAGWAEAAVLVAAARSGASSGPVRVAAPNGAVAEADVSPDGRVLVRVRCGDPLDHVVLRSYCTGAAHMALGWVSSEAIAVDESGRCLDLTIRSFGVLRASDTPSIEVEIEADDRPPVAGSDAVFVAVAAAAWIAQGCPPEWPTGHHWR
ncbi:MAG: 2Fe-2S iron-sulfur cluster-binding protein [Acidimicrobiales bacterium]